jgi:flavorubredoxin
MTDVLTARYICVGSPTLNNNIMPTVSAFLTYLKGLAPRNKTGLAFGSYGWGGQSIDMVDEMLKECKFETLEKIKVRYVPDEAALAGITDKVKENL